MGWLLCLLLAIVGIVCLSGYLKINQEEGFPCSPTK